MSYLLAGAEAQAGHQRVSTADRMEVGICGDQPERLQGAVEYGDPRVKLRFAGTRQPPLRLGLTLQRPAHVDHGGPSRGHRSGRRLGAGLASRAQACQRPPLVCPERGEHEHVLRL
jgi:hypothetical protein